MKKKLGYKLIYSSANLSGRRERYKKKKLYVQKGRRVWNTGNNKVLKIHIDLIGSNKVSILDKSPVDKSPPTKQLHQAIIFKESHVP